MTHRNEEYKGSCILYGVVAKGSCMLASHCAKVGNFNDVAKDLLVRIDQQVKSSSSPSASRMTYKDGEYLYHYLKGDDECVIYLCMTDATFPRKNAFQFLDIMAKKLKEQFPYQLKSYSKSMPFCINSEFEPVIGAEIKRANNLAKNGDEVASSESEQSESEEISTLTKAGPSNSGDTQVNTKRKRKKIVPGDPDKVERVRDEVARVKDIMVTNIEALLERGERLDLLVDKTEQLSSNAVTFKQASRTLARRMWWQNFKVWIVIAIVVLVLIYIIISASCGGPLLPNCVGKGGNGTHHP